MNISTRLTHMPKACPYNGINVNPTYKKIKCTGISHFPGLLMLWSKKHRLSVVAYMAT